MQWDYRSIRISFGSAIGRRAAARSDSGGAGK